MSKNLSKIWLKYDQNKKVCFPKKFKIVTTLQQNVSNRGGDGDGGGNDVGGFDSGYDGGGSVGVGVG